MKPVIAFVLIALLSATVATVEAQDGKTIIANASKAMGADNLKTVQYSGEGTEYSFAQAFNRTSGWPAFPLRSYTRTINFETPAWQIQRMSGEASPTRQGGGNPGPANQVVIVNANTPWNQVADYWSTPYGFLRAAATMPVSVKSQTVAGKKYNVVTFTAPSRARVIGYINDQNMVEKVETWVDTPLTGDTLLESDYTNYQDFAGVKFPMKIVQKQGGYPILDITVKDVKPNAPAEIQAPQARAAAEARPTTSMKLDEGVYAILPAYSSLAVDFKDYIVVYEGPQSEERANATIAEIKRVIPNKPIRYLINSHWHIDHSGGLRAFVAEGATIITHEMNKDWLENVLNAPHTLNPDRQERVKQKVKIETAGDKKVLTDGNHVIELHHVKGSNHVASLLMAYLPKQKVLVQADGFNPPATLGAPVQSRNAGNMLENVERLKLDVETVIPVHYPADGRKVTMAEWLKAVGRGN